MAAKKKATGQPPAISRNEARKAASDAITAQAKADSDRIAGEVRLEELRRQPKAETPAEKQARELVASENSWTGKAVQIGMNTTAAAGGYILGKKMADKIDVRHKVTMAQRKTQASELAKVAGKITGEGKWDKARIKAIDYTAKKQGLTSIKGPVGLISAGILLAEGAASRYLSTQIKNESAAEAFRALSTGSVFAASALLGTRVVQNATPSVLPKAADTMQIRAAHYMAQELKAADAEKAKVAKQAAAAAKLQTPAQKKAVASKVAKAAKATAVATKLPASSMIPAGHPSASAFSRLMGAGAKIGAPAAKTIGKTIGGGLTVTGLVMAAATGYDAGSNAASAAGFSNVKKNLAGGATAVGVVGVGYGLARGATATVAAVSRTGVAKAVTGAMVKQVAGRIALRAVPYVGTALLIGDAIRLARAGMDAIRNSEGNQKRIRANARYHVGQVNRAIMAGREAKARVTPVSDNMTAAHYRKEKSGKMTYVKAYATPR